MIDPNREHLALYGSLMACVDGLGRLGDTSALFYVSPCTIQGQLVDLGRYPGLVAQEGLVEAELYEVADPTLFEALDRFEGYHPHDPRPSLYVRRRIKLHEPACEAWVYVYNKPAAGLRVIESGSWLQHLRERRD
ncbi:MAG: gamma-glutamylcyclotransferase [Actinobacteria bacterium]|nr:gamma-glutamylcyclotransferase [Actinomycetota bacterium]